MAQILDSLPPEQSGKILCCYVNATSKIQVARISNISNWYFERVVFPGQRLVFEAPVVAQLEIHTGAIASAILSDTIPCARLVVNELNRYEWETDADLANEPMHKKSLVQSINTNAEDSIRSLKVAGLVSID